MFEDTVRQTICLVAVLTFGLNSTSISKLDLLA